MSRRYVIRVVWVAKARAWHVTGGASAAANIAQRWADKAEKKSTAIGWGAGMCKEIRKTRDVLTQLVVHNKDGRIAFERTYGADPRRRKG